MFKFKLKWIKQESAMDSIASTRPRRMRRSRWLAVAGVAAFAAALVVGVAAAANILPNPGFENTCPGASCGWSATLVNTTIGSDTSTKASGASSVKVTGLAGLLAGISTCVALSPGPHTASYYYFAPNTNTISLSMHADYFSTPSCLSGGTYGGSLFGSTRGSWTQTTGTFTAPAGTVSARVYLLVDCAANAACSANFDDVSLDAGGTTAATMRSFTTSRSPAGTLVRWRTAAETELAGFNVYRVADGRKVRLNRRLIAAIGKGGGASYRFLDRGHRGAYYRLEVVNVDGTHQWRTAR